MRPAVKERIHLGSGPDSGGQLGTKSRGHQPATVDLWLMGAGVTMPMLLGSCSPAPQRGQGAAVRSPGAWHHARALQKGQCTRHSCLSCLA